MSKVVGIDLGTTYSAIAHLEESGIPKIIPNGEGKNITPSVVYIKERQIIVGEEAQSFTVLEPMNTVECVKRNMGKKDYKVFVDSEEYTPVEISSWILCMETLKKNKGNKRYQTNIFAYFFPLNSRIENARFHSKETHSDVFF